MSELTATDIKVWNGSAWVSGFNVYNGTSFQNVNDGKVNIRGNDGNWYKKNGSITTISPTTNGFSNGKYSLLAQSQNYSTLHSQVDCALASAFMVWQYFYSSWYQLQRGLLRFDFTNVVPFIFNSVKLELYSNMNFQKNEFRFYEEISIYKFNNDSIPSITDFSNFGNRYSEIAKCTFTPTKMTIEFNSVGITALQNAVSNQSIITFMLRTRADSENIVPTLSNSETIMVYTDSKLIFLK